jgi:hypothetical protein
MSQVNKYANRAAYEADNSRLKTQSAVSYVEDDGELIYDGVNTVVRKSAAGVGDLVVFDKTDEVLKFIKGATLVADKMPAELVPAGVVYGRHGDKVRIVSLENATYNGSTSIRWAAPYEVALSGFDLAAGGTFTLRINSTDYPFTYSAGATLESIAAQINANTTISSTYGWAATVDSDERIIMSSNTFSPVYATIEVVGGCTITRPAEDVNYQTALTGVLIESASENIRRRNNVNSSFAGCNPEIFLQYYSANGSTATNTQSGSSTIIRRSVFTKADNPVLVALYPTYEDYLFGEHLLQFPSAYGALLRDGRDNTRLIGTMRFIDIYGNSSPCYPAAAAALDYGVTVEGTITGLEDGAWWLPSANEIYLLMHDRALTAADKESDPVNRTLSRLGNTTCYGAGYYPWTSCEYSGNNVFIYSGYTGNVGSAYKAYAYSTRPVSEI